MKRLALLATLLSGQVGTAHAWVGSTGPYDVVIPGGTVASATTQAYDTRSAVQNYRECIPKRKTGFVVGQPGSFAGPYPALVLVHGGAWSGGTNTIDPRQLDRPADQREQVSGVWCQNFASYGFHAFSIGYRRTGEKPWPAQAADVQTAIRYIRANATALGVAKGFVACMGDSAGAQICGVVGYSSTVLPVPGETNSIPAESSQVQAVISAFGPWTWGPGRPAGAPSVAVSDYAAQMLLDHANGVPNTYTPNTLIVAGTKDTTVPPCSGANPNNGVAWFDYLKGRSRPVHFRSVPSGHEFSNIDRGTEPGVWAGIVGPIIDSEIKFLTAQANYLRYLPAYDTGPNVPIDDSSIPVCPLS